LEVVLLLLVVLQGARTALVRSRTASLLLAQAQADQIRRAWDELGQQGGLMHARLTSADAAAGPEALRAEIEKAGRAARLGVSIGKGQPTRIRSGLKGTRMIVTGTGPEDRLIEFLLAVDRIPVLAHVESLTLRGRERKGEADLRLVMVHDEIRGRLRNRLAALVADLPNLGKPPVPGAGAPRRLDPLFVTAGRTEEQILTGWPRIILNGFTAELALFEAGGESRMLQQGQTVTADIEYRQKLAVNQALLVRKSDGAKVVVTVGSSAFTVFQGQVEKGFNDFSLVFPRGGASEVFRAASEAGAPK
jgi:hypothetical protein